MKRKSSLFGCLNKKGRHAELDSASHLISVLESGEIPYQVRNDKCIFDDNHAFTLIELLVVVLIIGIFAAVALPQYQKAVEKSKAAQALTMLKSVYNAAEAYVLTNGEWPTSLDELALDIDWTGTTATTNSASSEIKSNDEWSFRLQGSFASAASVSMTRISGKYAGAGFLLVNKYVDATLPTGTLLCHEQFSGPFTIEVAGTYCEKIFKGKFLRQGAEQRYYSMP